MYLLIGDENNRLNRSKTNPSNFKLHWGLNKPTVAHSFFLGICNNLEKVLSWTNINFKSHQLSSPSLLVQWCYEFSLQAASYWCSFTSSLAIKLWLSSVLKQNSEGEGCIKKMDTLNFVFELWLSQLSFQCLFQAQTFFVPCGPVYHLGSKLMKVPKPSPAPWLWHFGTSSFLIWTEFVAKNCSVIHNAEKSFGSNRFQSLQRSKV